MVMPIRDLKPDGAAGADTVGGRRCAWHGHWIGGVSPSRGELVATARNVSTILRQPSVEFKLGCLAFSAVD
jgi:hypothetical protein